MKRKIIFVLTALLICLFSLSAVAIFTGCNCNGKNLDPDDEKTCKLRIVDAPDTLKVGSLKKLIYLLPNGEDYSKIVFESGNPSVATIEITEMSRRLSRDKRLSAANTKKVKTSLR